MNGSISIALLGGINWWMFERGKRSQGLLKLVEQIEEYNQIVHSIAALATVSHLTNLHRDLDSTTTIYEILAHTRHNLLIALEMDRYLRHHPQSAPFNSIAHNLIQLQHLSPPALQE